MIYDLDGMLPARAFQRDARGQIQPQSGGGSSAPSQQSVTQTSIPEYARPYVEKTLGQTAALTDINQNPYQPFQGQRIAEFSPLQQQAMGSIAGQQTAPQLQAATRLATQSGQGGLQAFDTSGQLQSQALGYGAQGANLGILGGGLYGGQAAQAGGQYANIATSPGAVSQYMSPYMQNAVDVQKQEAIRDYQKTMPMLGAQAAKSGAFGGSRQAITEAEAQRNVNQQLANIQATGSQQAYDRAIQSMQYGSNLGLQGLQTGLQGVNTQLAGTGQGMQGVQGAVGAGQYGLQGLGTAGTAASTLGALGQTQFGQEMAINQAQMQAGALQQAQAQRGLDIPYQEYQEQLNYPYKQLAFQSDMFRGLPLSQSAQTIYQNTGAMAPQLLGAGIAAYGATQRAKEGGLIKGYAEGGTTTVDPSVPSSIGPQALSSRLSKLSDEQLMAYARTVTDAVALAEVQGEIQRRQEARAPQGQIPTSTVAQSMMPQETMAQPPMMAGGGIVALARGGNEKTELREFIGSQQSEAVRRNLENELLKDARHLDAFYGGALGSTRQRNDARALIKDLQGAPIDALRSFKASGLTPSQQQSQIQYGADQGQPINPAVVAAARNEAAQQMQALDADSQVNPGQISPQQLQEMTAAANREELAQDADSQVQPTGTAPSSAPPGTVPGGIVPSRAPAGQAPAGQAPAGQAPAASTGSTGVVPSSRAPTAMAGGAVPIANPGDPMGWSAYKANVDDMAKLDPEQKAVLDDMRKRTERRMSRAEKQESNVAYDAMIAGGLAMMGGLNLSDGVRRLAEGGGKKYFESSAEARKAIDAADDAQSAFDQYQLSLKQGNKKVAADMYGKYFNTMADFQGKIQAASISAGASRDATAEAARSRAQAQENILADRQTARAQQQQQFDLQIQQQERQFKENLLQRQDVARLNQFEQLDRTYATTMDKRDKAERDVLAEFRPKFERFAFIDPAKMSEADKRQLNLLNTQLQEAKLTKLSKWDNQLEEIQNRKAAMMGIRPIGGGSGTTGAGGNIPTYDPRTGNFK